MFFATVLGMMRIDQYIMSLKNDASLYGFADQKYAMIGNIITEPDIRLSEVLYTLRITALNDTEITPSRILVKAPRYPRYAYGDVVYVTCKIRTPEPIENFAYDAYLLRYKIVKTCSFPQIRIFEEQQETFNFLSEIFVFKTQFATVIERLWHEPYASFMAGLLYGYRGGLGNLQELFNITGVTHIVAISGYNITMVSTICLSIVTRFGIRRQYGFWIVCTAISVFVLFTGASASVVRAGIMGILVLISRQIGRCSNSANMVLCASVCMCVHNPYILMHDAGFQLSVLATLGLIYGPDMLESYFKKFPTTLSIQENAMTTSAAIIATLPLTITQFGRISFVAPIVNILILWILPYSMFFGFFAVLVSIISFDIARILAGIAYICMEYVIQIVRWFSSVPYAAIEVQISSVYMYIFYAILVIMVYYTQKKKRKKHGSVIRL